MRRHGPGFRADVMVGGERHYGPVFDRPEEAARYAEAYRLAGTTSRAPTFGEGMALVRQALAADARSAGTLAFYESHWSILSRRWNLETPLHSISAEAVQAWITSRLSDGVSATAVRHDIVALKRVTKLAAQAGKLPIDPLAKLRPPKARRGRRDVLHPRELGEHVAKIRAAGRTRVADVLELAFLTGMRRAELSRLTAADVDLQNRRLHVAGKTDTRELPITEDAVPVLQRLLAAKREPLIGTVDAIADLFREAKAITGDARLHPHALRHSAATALAHAGITPYVLRDLLGHKHLQQTLIYYHASGAQARDAIAVLRLPPPEPPPADTLPPRARKAGSGATRARRGTPARSRTGAEQ